MPDARLVEAAERPNVLFLICDDLNCDIGCYGHSQVKTPHLDALAAQSTTFDDAFAQVSFTLPSHASMLSGQYPSVHGIDQFP